MNLSQGSQVNLTHIQVYECLDLKPAPTLIFPHVTHALQFSAPCVYLIKDLFLEHFTFLLISPRTPVCTCAFVCGHSRTHTPANAPTSRSFTVNSHTTSSRKSCLRLSLSSYALSSNSSTTISLSFQWVLFNAPLVDCKLPEHKYSFLFIFPVPHYSKQQLMRVD